MGPTHVCCSSRGQDLFAWLVSNPAFRFLLSQECELFLNECVKLRRVTSLLLPHVIASMLSFSCEAFMFKAYIAKAGQLLIVCFV